MDKMRLDWNNSIQNIVLWCFSFFAFFVFLPRKQWHYKYFQRTNVFRAFISFIWVAYLPSRSICLKEIGRPCGETRTFVLPRWGHNLIWLHQLLSINKGTLTSISHSSLCTWVSARGGRGGQGSPRILIHSLLNLPNFKNLPFLVVNAASILIGPLEKFSADALVRVRTV